MGLFYGKLECTKKAGHSSCRKKINRADCPHVLASKFVPVKDSTSCARTLRDALGIKYYNPIYPGYLLIRKNKILFFQTTISKKRVTENFPKYLILKFNLTKK